MPEISLISKRDLEKENIAKRRDYYAVFLNSLLRNNRYIGEAKGHLPSLQESRIFLYAVCCIQPTDTYIKPITLKIKDFGLICGFDAAKGNHYSQTKEVVLRLASRVMWIKGPDGSDELVHLVKDATIAPSGGEITFSLDPKLGPYLLNVSSDYSKFQFHDVLRMKSQYGVWLWMVLTCFAYKDIQSLTFDIDELKAYLDCTNYKKISHLKEKVIEMAVRDINTYTSMKVTDVTYEKVGRTIKFVTFHIQNLLKIDPAEYQMRYLQAEKELAEGLNA